MVKLLCKKNAEIEQSKQGFTLVELVVVIAVLAILAAIAIPVIGTVISNAVKNVALANAHTLDYSIRKAQADIEVMDKSTYTYDYGQSPPQIVTLDDVVQENGIAGKTFEKVTYKDHTYSLFWDEGNGVVVAENSSSTIDINGEVINSHGNMIALCDNGKPNSSFGTNGYNGDVSLRTLK